MTNVNMDVIEFLRKTLRGMRTDVNKSSNYEIACRKIMSKVDVLENFIDSVSDAASQAPIEKTNP